MADPLSATEILAIDLAFEAERAGLPIGQFAKRGQFSDGLIALAEQVREVVAEVRRNLHADAAVLGKSEDQLDAAFSDMLSGMLGRSRNLH